MPLKLSVVDLTAADACDRLVEACSHVGFQVVVGHGAEAQIEAAVRTGESMMAGLKRGDLETHRASHYRPGLQTRAHMNREEYRTVEGTYRPFDREDFVMVNPDAAERKREGDPYYAGAHGEIWYGEADNNFPTKTSQEVFERYYRAMERVCDRIMRHLGRGLSGNEEMFLHATSKHTSNAVVAYHAAAPPAPVAVRVTPHSDTGLITLIAYGAGGPEGLEVKDSNSGEWVPVDTAAIPPGALVLNGDSARTLVVYDPLRDFIQVGDSLHRLSNGRLLSTPHRVIEPRTSPRSATDRLALIFFFAARYDVDLAPVCVAGEQPRFRSTVAGKLTHNYLVAPTALKGAFDAWSSSARLSKL